MSKERFEDLRRKAEQQLASQEHRIPNLARADLESLAHELAVHQVELEIQNEELRLSRTEAEAARDRYLDLFDFAPMGYFILDGHNRIVEANLRGCQLLKMDKGNLLKKTFTKFIQPDESEKFYLQRRKVLESGIRQAGELQMQKEDGTPFYAQIESLKVGKERLRLAVMDITERKQADEALRESEQRFRKMFEEHQAIMLLIEPESGLIVDANPAACEFYGYPSETLKNMKITDINQLPLAQVAEERRKALNKEISRFIFPHRLACGEVRIVEVNTSPVNMNNRQILFSIINDITDRNKAETALVVAKDKLQNILSSINDGFFALDANFNLTYFNRSAEHILQRKASEVIGRHFLEAFPEAKGSIFEEKYSQALKDRKPLSFEAYFAPQRYQNWYDVRVFPSNEGITVFFQVITERKKAEEDLQRYSTELEATNKELEAFSYSISHDLRAPLRTLDGFSQAVIQDYGDQLDEKGRDYLLRIRTASQRMSQLIEDILKLSRITRADMNKDEVKLSDLAKSIAGEIKTAQPERHAEFIIQPDITVRGDRRLLDVALRNLMENSWKFTSKCPRALIEFGVESQDGKQVYFVKDNGAGFNMHYADKLFQPFQRLHSDKEFPGTGIGLATVQRVIRRHGGRIWAESEIGKGATFYFTLD